MLKVRTKGHQRVLKKWRPFVRDNGKRVTQTVHCEHHNSPRRPVIH